MGSSPISGTGNGLFTIFHLCSFSDEAVTKYHYRIATRKKFLFLKKQQRMFGFIVVYHHSLRLRLMGY